jgi:hypothetical protein
MASLATDLSLDCKAAVLFEYSITNIDVEKNTIEDIRTSLKKIRPFTSSIDEIPISDRTILRGHTLTSSKSESLDFCSAYGESGEAGLTFEVIVDCAGGYTFTTVINHTFDDILPPKCNIDLEISCEASDGGPCLPLSQSNECTFRPHFFDFVLSGGFCADSTHDQGSGSFVCVDGGDMTGYTDFFVVVEGIKSSENYFSGFVSPNEVFSVGHGSEVDSDIKAFIFSQRGGILLQTLRFQSSCSKNLSLGDIFGGITVVGFRDYTHNLTHRPDAVTPVHHLSYKINNQGANEIFLQNLIFHSKDNANGTVVRTETSTVGSTNSLSGVTPGFNIAFDDFEATATLKYRTLPDFNSRDCVATAEYKTSICARNNSGSKGSKTSSSKHCASKSSKSNMYPSSSGKGGKGSKSSKSSEGQGSESAKHPASVKSG